MRRAKTNAHRSAWEAFEQVWDDVKYGVVLLLIATAIARIAFGLPLDQLVVANLIAFAALPLIVFLWLFARNIRRPDVHDEWLREPTRVGSHPSPNIRFSVRSKSGVPYQEQYGCVVRHPNGEEYRVVDESAGSGYKFFFTFPDDFDAAPQAENGTYEICWLFPGRHVRLRPTLMWSEVITLE